MATEMVSESENRDTSPDFLCARYVRGVGVGANRLPTWEISRLDSYVRP